jgi:acyl phosphate:glycerol-3-phosphate acyltransferase
MGHLSLLLIQLKPILCIIGAYLIGSIPTSYLIGRIFFHTDIRQSGSGNTGATNALRTFGATTGIIVLVLDMLKGVIVVLLAKYLLTSSPTEFAYNLYVSLCALAVIMGHVFSIFLRFKGGKGVATAAGVFLTLLPIPFLYCVVLFVIIVYMSKYVSLGSILAASAFLIVELFSQYILNFPNIPRLVLVAVIVILILIRHKANFIRLFEGSENKISFKKTNKG